MSNQSKEGCCKRINTLEKLPKLQFSSVQAVLDPITQIAKILASTIKTPLDQFSYQQPTSGRIKNTVVSSLNKDIFIVHNNT